MISKFKILRTLGTGASCKVKLGQDTSTGKKVAVKIIKSDIDDETMNLLVSEISALSKVKHENVICLIEYGKGQYLKDSGKKKEVYYIVLELATGGEIFDFIAISGKFDEPTARYFFKQLMEGLDHCHNKGFTHRDLKPENLLLDENNTLKIADFGFAAPVEGRNGEGYLKTYLGTTNYMAPEIHAGEPYQGRSIDIFSSAVILFIMLTQHQPF